MNTAQRLRQKADIFTRKLEDQQIKSIISRIENSYLSGSIKVSSNDLPREVREHLVKEGFEIMSFDECLTGGQDYWLISW